MSLRELVKADLILDEGNELMVYPDSEGNPTVGIGHLVTSDMGLYISDTITGDTRDQLFETDLDTATNDARKYVNGGQPIDHFSELPLNVRRVLINMAFNLGYNKLSRWVKMRPFVLQGRYSRAADEIVLSLCYVKLPKRYRRLETLMRGA